MCDLENESQSAPKDIFKVTHGRSYSSNYTSYFRAETRKIDTAKQVGMVKLH